MDPAPSSPVTTPRARLQRMLASMSIVVALATGAAVTGSTAAVAVEPTTTTMSLSAEQVYLGEPVTATATVSAATGVPSGSITFTVVGSDVVETSVPLVNGVATLVLDDLVPGWNRVAADYSGADGFAPSKDWSWDHFVNVVEFVPPVLTRASPEVIATGRKETVHVYGSHVTDATVTFDGVPVTPVTVGEYFVAFEVPAHAAGSFPIVVTTPAGTSNRVLLTIVDASAGIVSQAPVRIDSGVQYTDFPTCLQIAGTGTVPWGATGVILNVTTTRVYDQGYVVVYPDSLGNKPVPASSTVNFEPGSDVANTAFVALSPEGRICYRTSHPGPRVLLDVTGFTMPGSGIELQDPVRLLDTRTSAPVAPGAVQTVQVTGRAGVPAGAAAVIVNVTATQVAGAGNLRVFPAGRPVPNASVVNYTPGRDKANATIVPLSSSGKLSFVSDTGGATAHVILDVAGYVTAGGAYRGQTPSRVLDTRPGAGRVGALAGPLQSRKAYTVQVPSAMVPKGATSVVLNVTAIGPSSLGNLRVYPAGSRAVPEVSTINYIAGRDIPNLVVVALPKSGPAAVTLYSDMGAGGTVHVAADVAGFVVAP